MVNQSLFIDHTKLRTDHQSEYHALRNAIHRCHVPTSRFYHNYGARGLYVFEQWRQPVIGFAAFLDHIGAKPDPCLTLERVCNDTGYVPGNVEWATRKRQSMNRRVVTDSPLLTIDGVTKSEYQWARESGCCMHTIRWRMRKGITDPKLLYAPPR